MWDVLPEIVLALSACVCLLLATLKRIKATMPFSVALFGLVVATGLHVHQGMLDQVTWHGHLQHDAASYGFSLVTMLVVASCLFFSRRQVRSQQKRLGEYYALVLLSTTGMLGMIKASSLLMLFLGLELMSLPLYALVAMGKEASIEAALKYFVLGALATGLLLYGCALLYGVTGSFMYSDIIASLAQDLSANQVSLLALSCVFLVTGMAFKLGLVPFHAWVPDVYEGTSTSMALFIATAPKVASVAMMMRLFFDVLPSAMPHWHSLWLWVAIASILLGNLSALMQNTWRRLIAYSSIGHMGFLTLGLLVLPEMGRAAMVIYTVIYALTTLLVLGVTLWLEDQGKSCTDMRMLSGLHKAYPLAAFGLLLGLLSLAGIPPIAGFMAKLSIVMALVHEGFVGVAILALLGSVIALYYYIRVIKRLYFDQPDEHVWVASPSSVQAWALAIPAILMLVLGLFPTSVLVQLF